MKNDPIKALLIEDDPDDTLILMDLLARSGYPSFQFTLTCAENLQTGLTLLSEGEVEVVLLDLMLPDSQGIETVRRTRAQAPNVPIVVLTGLRDETMGLEALAHGAQDYQVKGSIEEHAFKRTISYAVERHRLLSGLERLIAGAADAMVVVDSKGLVQFANAAAETLFGKARPELLGKPFPYSLVPGRSTEIKVPCAAGEKTAEARVAEIEWNNRAARLVTIRDITDLRRVEQLKAEIKERRRLDQLKDQLISTVSHEMRTPLSVIKAAVDNLEEGLAGPLSEQQSTLVTLAHNNVKRLLKVVNNILDLSRLESGQSEIHRERVDLGALIKETLKGLRLAETGKQILIEEDVPVGLPPVYADPDLLTEVVSNLIDNALRFTRSKVVIAISESSEQRPPKGGGSGVLTARRCLQVRVTDDGPGIPKDRAGELFNKFVQVNRSMGGAGYKGTGLGLAICKEIVERQDGRIWMECAEGQGASFCFNVPLHEGGGERHG